MLKSLALAGIFFLASAVSTQALSSTTTQKASGSMSAPTAPRPQGICVPAGSRC